MNIKEEQKERKIGLKKIASEIKKMKLEVKESQRKHTTYCKENGFRETPSYWNLYYDTISPVRKQILKNVNGIGDLQNKLLSLQCEYRRNHIIYSLYNGTPMDKIEKPIQSYNDLTDDYRKGNIDENTYQRLLQRYYKRTQCFYCDREVMDRVVKYQQKKQLEKLSLY